MWTVESGVMSIATMLKWATNHKAKIGLAVLLVYISVVNVVYLRTTPEVIAIQFGLLTIFFFDSRTRSFAKTWVPFIAAFVAFEFFRGIADDLSPWGRASWFLVYDWEVWLFGKLPTEFFQEYIAYDSVVTTVLFFFYGMFFYYSFLVGFVLWMVKKNRMFGEYAIRFVLLCYFGLLWFWLIPTAPPWVVSELGELDVSRYIYENKIVTEMAGLSIYGHYVYGNPVAALPSLHTAWPAFTSLFLIRRFRKRIYWIGMVVPMMIGLAVVVTAEHYVIDVALGFGFGWVFAYGKLGVDRAVKWVERQVQEKAR